MIVLDTNVLSELMKPMPNADVLNWLDGQVPGTVAVTAITVAEVWFGIHRMPAGRRKVNLEQAAAGMFEADLDIILPFDESAAIAYAVLVAACERIGRPMSMADAQIAAICSSHGASLATRNVSDFTDARIAVINPWDLDR